MWRTQRQERVGRTAAFCNKPWYRRVFEPFTSYLLYYLDRTLEVLRIYVELRQKGSFLKSVSKQCSQDSFEPTISLARPRTGFKQRKRAVSYEDHVATNSLSITCLQNQISKVKPVFLLNGSHLLKSHKNHLVHCHNNASNIYNILVCHC